MAVVKFSELENSVYVVMGIDHNGHDQVLAVADSCAKAKALIGEQPCHEYFDLWVEKHTLL